MYYLNEVFWKQGKHIKMYRTGGISGPGIWGGSYFTVCSATGYDVMAVTVCDVHNIRKYSDSVFAYKLQMS